MRLTKVSSGLSDNAQSMLWSRWNFGFLLQQSMRVSGGRQYADSRPITTPSSVQCAVESISCPTKEHLPKFKQRHAPLPVPQYRRSSPRHLSHRSSHAP